MGRILLLVTAVSLVVVGCAHEVVYTGKVVDSHARPVFHAIVLGEYAGKPGVPDSAFVQTILTDENGFFILRFPDKIKEISATSYNRKQKGVLSYPSTSGSVITIR